MMVTATPATGMEMVATPVMAMATAMVTATEVEAPASKFAFASTKVLRFPLPVMIRVSLA